MTRIFADYKGKISPLINADATDQQWKAKAITYRGFCADHRGYGQTYTEVLRRGEKQNLPLMTLIREVPRLFESILLYTNVSEKT